MAEQYVQLKWVESGVALVTIARERSLNALNSEVLDQLEASLDVIEANPEARVAVVTGQGNKAFVAGADISAINQAVDEEQARGFAERGQKLFQRFQTSRVLFIAAINGYALGGGMELAMALDIRVAAESARLGQPEINLGIIPGFGGTQRLTRLIGYGRALWMIASGQPVLARDALEMGLVEAVVPLDSLLDECLARARELAKKAPLALAECKWMAVGSRDWDITMGLKKEAQAFARLAVSGDGKEGTRAFLEKRSPEFRGN